MGLFQNEIKIVETPKHNTHTNVKIEEQWYDAIRYNLYENNTLTVKEPVVVNEQTKTQISIVLN